MPSGGRRPGTGGANRKTTEAKRLMGTLRPGREARYRTKDLAALNVQRHPVGEPPAELPEDEQRSWRALALAMDSLGGIQTADRPAFCLLVEARADLERARVRLGEVDSKGRAVISLSGYTALSRAVSSALGQLGLTTASRGPVRVVTAAPASASPEDDPDALTPLGDIRPAGVRGVE